MNSEFTYELQAFFLEAAGKCYVGDHPKTSIAELPKSKVYRFERDPFLYLDTYLTNGESSGGQTVLYHDDQPVWLMQYHGWCGHDDPVTLAFLKRALSENYQAGEWFGGRGPVRFAHENWPGIEYWNSVDNYRRDFHDFSGYESIHTSPTTGDPIFWHRYQGFLLAQD